MSSDVVIGYHGKPRCAWAGAGDNAFGRYHDEVWGSRTYDESAMFEALTLGVFEVGLSWSIVFGKRDAFRAAFQGFEVAKVAAMTELDVDRLVQEASIMVVGERWTLLIMRDAFADRPCQPVTLTVT